MCDSPGHITALVPTISEFHEYVKDHINVYLLIFWHKRDLILGEIGVIVSGAALN